ncbi:MAG: alpha-ketoglutarate transporter, partial [Steroidobacteraceae bacterium]
LYSAISGLYKAELFPTEIRALGVGLPYAIATSVVGGTAEYVALSLKHAGHESWFYWYVTGFMALALLTAAFMRDTQAHSRIIES